MTSLKNFLFKDYEWEEQPCGNKKGHRLVYRYKGKWKRWDMTCRKLLRLKITMSFLFLSGAFSFFAGSSVLCDINRIKAVQAFTLLSFAALVFLLFGLLLFICSGTRITEAEAILQKQTIRWSAGVGAAVFLAALGVGIMMQKSALKPPDIQAVALSLPAVLCETAVLVLQRKLKSADA